jgi:hypothetical protein
MHTPTPGLLWCVPMSFIRVLHVSDLHARAESRIDQDEIVAAMLADATTLADARPFDLAVVSGDLAFAGKAKEYEIARKLLLDRVQEQLGLGPDRTIMVPGNHDVDRSMIDEITELGLAQYLCDRELVNRVLDQQDQLAAAVRRLEAWEAFRKDFYAVAPSRDSAPLAQTWLLDLDGSAVGAAALNSAWRCSGDDDRHKLLLGDRQVKNALDAIAGADVRLVALHHPTEWLMAFDEDLARGLFEQRMTIVFSGHEHAADPVSQMSSRGQAIYSRAGCLYETHEYRNSYNVVDIDAESGRVTIGIRAWSQQRRAFDAALDVTSEGRLEFTLPMDRLLPVAVPRYTPVLQGLGDLAHEVSVVADRLPDRAGTSIEDLLVARRFWPLPYEEVAAARELDEEAAPEPVDAVGATATCQVVVVSGEAESGVTSALLWLLAQHFERDDQRLPAYVRYERGFSKDQRFERAVRKAAGRLGMPLERGEELPRVLVAVDDVDIVHKPALDGFLRYIAEHPDQRFVLGCHGDDAALAERLRARDIPFQGLYLGPFGRAELRELIAKLVGHGSPELLDKVFDVALSQQLPRSPFVLAALVAVLSEEADVTALNVSGLLDAYAKWLLGGEEAADLEGLGMDYRRREHLLGYLAAVLVRTARRRLPRQEAERQVLEYFAARGWSNSSTRILDSLIRRRVLVEDADGIGFRHPALLNLFAGHAMLDDQSFAGEVMQDCFAYRGAVEHAAGLRRSDRDLLIAVDEAFRGVLTGLGDEVRAEMFDHVSTLPGWSEDEPDFEQLKAAVANETATETLDDEQLDLLYDKVESQPRTPTAELALPPLLVAMGPATGLLARVLRNSELVDDVALKADVLQRVLHAWGLFTIVAALREDQTDELRARLQESMLEEDADTAAIDRLDRLTELVLVFMLVLVASGATGAQHLEIVLERILDDDEFMAVSVHALFATMLFANLGFLGWPKRLAALYERHRRHPLVAELARVYALISYRQRRASGSDERHLENFLVDSHESAPRASGATAIVRRGATRSALVAQLRKSRDSAQRAVERSD